MGHLGGKHHPAVDMWSVAADADGNHLVRVGGEILTAEMMPVLVQALKAIGKENLTDEHLGQIRRLLAEHPEEQSWQTDMQLAPAWIRKVVTDIKKENVG